MAMPSSARAGQADAAPSAPSPSRCAKRRRVSSLIEACVQVADLGGRLAEYLWLPQDLCCGCQPDLSGGPEHRTGGEERGASLKRLLRVSCEAELLLVVGIKERRAYRFSRRSGFASSLAYAELCDCIALARPKTWASSRRLRRYKTRLADFEVAARVLENHCAATCESVKS